MVEVTKINGKTREVEVAVLNHDLVRVTIAKAIVTVVENVGFVDQYQKPQITKVGDQYRVVGTDVVAGCVTAYWAKTIDIKILENNGMMSDEGVVLHVWNYLRW